MPMNEDVTGKPNGITNSEFQLLPAEPEDAESIQRCAMRANVNSQVHARTYPKEKAHLASPEELFRFRVERLRKSMYAEDTLHFKATPKDDASNVIGHAVWCKPGHFKVGESITATFAKTDAAAPASMDVDAMRIITGTMDAQRKAYWGDDSNYWYLGSLFVDPRYQRRGLATALVKIGLDQADAENLPAYLEASPEGALLYARLGFKRVAVDELFDGKLVIQYQVRTACGVGK